MPLRRLRRGYYVTLRFVKHGSNISAAIHMSALISGQQRSTRTKSVLLMARRQAQISIYISSLSNSASIYYVLAARAVLLSLAASTLPSERNNCANYCSLMAELRVYSVLRTAGRFLRVYTEATDSSSLLLRKAELLKNFPQLLCASTWRNLKNSLNGER